MVMVIVTEIVERFRYEFNSTIRREELEPIREEELEDKDIFVITFEIFTLIERKYFMELLSHMSYTVYILVALIHAVKFQR